MAGWGGEFTFWEKIPGNKSPNPTEHPQERSQWMNLCKAVTHTSHSALLPFEVALFSPFPFFFFLGFGLFIFFPFFLIRLSFLPQPTQSSQSCRLVCKIRIHGKPGFAFPAAIRGDFPLSIEHKTPKFPSCDPKPLPGTGERG